MSKRREWWIDPHDWRTDHGCQRVACFTKQEPDTVHVQEVPPGDFTNEEYHQRFLEDCGKIEALESRVAELEAAIKEADRAAFDHVDGCLNPTGDKVIDGDDWAKLIALTVSEGGEDGLRTS